MKAAQAAFFVIERIIMSDIDLAVKASKQIESTLDRMFGASGKGLHEKLTSVEKRLPVSLVKRIRYIATVRNKIIHDDEYRKFDDRAGFKLAVKQVKKELKSLEGRSSAGWWWMIIVLVCMLGALAVACHFEWLECLS